MRIIVSAKEFWRNRERRNRWLLAVLSAILAVLVVRRLLAPPETEPPGAMRKVMCVGCQWQGSMQVDDIDAPRYVCPKCGGKLAYAWKCEDCQFEYPLVPRTPAVNPQAKTMSKFQAAMQMHACPNCSSTSTGALPAD